MKTFSGVCQMNASLSPPAPCVKLGACAVADKWGFSRTVYRLADAGRMPQPLN